MGEFKCKKGCSECCGPVPISKEIYKKNKDKLQGKVNDILEVPGGEEIIPLCEEVKCPFLNRETNNCVIYEDRPQVCKDYGTGKYEDLICAYIKPNGNPRSPAMVKRVQRKINHMVDNNMKKFGVLDE